MTTTDSSVSGAGNVALEQLPSTSSTRDRRRRGLARFCVTWSASRGLARFCITWSASRGLARFCVMWSASRGLARFCVTSMSSPRSTATVARPSACRHQVCEDSPLMALRLYHDRQRSAVSSARVVMSSADNDSRHDVDSFTADTNNDDVSHSTRQLDN